MIMKATIGRAVRAIKYRQAATNAATTGRPITILANRQRGFSLVTAIFLLVVLSAMGAFMLSISGTQHFTSLYAIQGAKAYHAARSGIEWGIANAIAGTCTTGQPLSPLGSLNSFTVTVDCDESSHNEAGNDYSVYTISSTAQSGLLGTPDFSARSIQAVFTNSP